MKESEELESEKTMVRIKDERITGLRCVLSVAVQRKDKRLGISICQANVSTANQA